MPDLWSRQFTIWQWEFEKTGYQGGFGGILDNTLRITLTSQRSSDLRDAGYLHIVVSNDNQKRSRALEKSTLTIQWAMKPSALAFFLFAGDQSWRIFELLIGLGFILLNHCWALIKINGRNAACSRKSLEIQYKKEFKHGRTSVSAALLFRQAHARQL